ncbi:hypothetical protein LAZ67_4002893 [Cordylochernes scorpioides]|uniref:Peptidase aspartic putative domain-containing protein n=1 Tax=Cordylochernes scorpioides TaxID=51811 RepID=A0ABY6KE87_9ARAC|nr:hypothetical protein LAZ67_4002893 [Cordylochernes scorpioides]
MVKKANSDIPIFKICIGEFNTYANQFDEICQQRNIRRLKLYHANITELFKNIKETYYQSVRSNTWETSETLFKEYIVVKNLYENFVFQIGEILKVENVSQPVKMEQSVISNVKLPKFNLPKTLIERYDNKREIIFSQLDKIFKIKLYKISTSKAMYELLDICNESLRNLETIGLEKNEMKLDTPIRQQWELSYDNQELPSYQKFISFSEKQAQSLMNTMKDTTSKEYLNKRVNTYNINHKLNQCNEFKQISIQNRIGYVKQNQLCSNCLRGNHSVDNCKITNRCFRCNKNHHSLLHMFASPESLQPSDVPSTSTSCCLSEANGSIQILLSTAITRIQDVNGEYQICRALLDNGSQRSLITKKCAANLGIPIRRKRKAVGVLILADPLFSKSREIDVILVRYMSERQSFRNLVHFSSELESEHLIKRFWELESIPLEDIPTKEEMDCESHYLKNVVRDESGRYIVRLPFKESAEKLGQSKSFAIRRFINLERRLEQNEKIYVQYKQFMNEYIRLGHMQASCSLQTEPKYYIPHHCILKAQPTKLRVVFDASTKTTTQISLNDLLHVGPNFKIIYSTYYSNSARTLLL